MDGVFNTGLHEINKKQTNKLRKCPWMALYCKEINSFAFNYSTNITLRCDKDVVEL